MNYIKILIVEDELIIAEDLKEILEDLDYEVCGMAISAREALQLIGTHNPDIILLDINIKGGKDGIDLAQDIKDQHRIPYIFLTSHADSNTLERAKATHPHGYLVKPFNENDVYAAIEMALSNFAYSSKIEHNENEDSGFVLSDSLFVKNNSMLVKLKLDDITHLQADANYTNVFTTEKRYVLRGTLKELEEKLSNKQFVRVHKSYVINLKAIDAIHAQEVHIGSLKIPLSRTQHTWLVSQIQTL